MCSQPPSELFDHQWMRIRDCCYVAAGLSLLQGPHVSDRIVVVPRKSFPN